VKGGSLEVKNMGESLADKILNMPHYYVHAVTIILMIITLVVPMALPVKMTQVSRDWYDFVEGIEDGSVVCVLVNYTPASFWEVGWAGALALDRIVETKQDVKFLAVGYYVEAEGDLINRLFYDPLPMGANLVEKHGLVYGEDMVNLGWLPGGDAAYGATGEDIWKTAVRDYGGTPLEELPMMQDIRTFEDIDYIIGLISVGVDQCMQQWTFRYGTPTTMAVTGESVAYAMPYVAAGQMTGCLYTVRGTAEYETMLGVTSMGTMLTNASSLLHVWLFLLIVIGTIFAFIQRSGGGR
jgi:hypothetical protein